eukprot:CAMPEP_0172824538 /NCGR_PEP_ID=MMETSP1075-20121228/18078_1 /TAXON_ID=2916 /ORGANISM="Ceratium fusus, Strain PA161109" /LENGTH=36 /DNA_ID= /DNA_START= /DNA_END= /DNA_ORIENTATION=
MSGVLPKRSQASNSSGHDRVSAVSSLQQVAEFCSCQ